jgi:hypothetical protein
MIQPTPTQQKRERLSQRLGMLHDYELEALYRRATRKIEQLRELRQLISSERTFRKGDPKYDALFPEVAAKRTAERAAREQARAAKRRVKLAQSVHNLSTP